MSANWDDLKPRLQSAVVMVIIGGSALWAGGFAFAILAVVATGAMIWELSRMTSAVGTGNALWLGVLAAAVLALNLWSASPWPLLALLAPAVLGVILPRRDRAVFFIYAIVIMLTGLCLVILRHSLGLMPVLWLLAVVIASDVMGYFAGRILGGPKFWPAVSPKKTWSGAAAGWVAAAVVGGAFWATGQGDIALLWISPLVAFAGQLGDIAESAIKRRAGVKDSSNLIPGHGGFLDRFDALAFAAILFAGLQLVVPVFSLVKG